jgi:MFS family permease
MGSLEVGRMTTLGISGSVGMTAGALAALLVTIPGLLIADRLGLVDRGGRDPRHRRRNLVVAVLTGATTLALIGATFAGLSAPLWQFLAYWILALPAPFLVGLIWITSRGRRLEEWDPFLEGRSSIRDLPRSFRHQSWLAIALMIVPGVALGLLLIATGTWTWSAT